jgi:hypothetical protein
LDLARASATLFASVSSTSTIQTKHSIISYGLKEHKELALGSKKMKNGIAT